MKSILPPILVVDDEPNMRTTIREFLVDEGYEVDLKQGGAGGLLEAGARVPVEPDPTKR